MRGIATKAAGIRTYFAELALLCGESVDRIDVEGSMFWT
jgi:hypothetical protein